VPRLTFVIPDFYPTRQSADSQAGLPRLPTLEAWLAGARVEALPGGWRAWLLAAHAPGLAQAALAPVAALAMPGGKGSSNDAQAATAAAPQAAQIALAHPWLATPVHFVAGLDTLRLHPAGLLVLDLGEQQALAADFGRVFAGSGWRLHASGRRELLLEGPSSAGVHSGDPARWLGGDPASGLPSGAGSGPLRRLGAELEMWLHEHPVNRAREARGQLAVSALWLWGGGKPLAPAVAGVPNRAPANLSQLHGADLLLDGLARHGGQGVPQLPTALVALPDATPAQDVLVLLCGGGTPDLAALQAIERDWLVPGFAQWRAGRWQSLTLVCGERAFHARAGGLAGLLRSLRSPAPWWQVLLAC
jgi:hypothetical protein